MVEGFLGDSVWAGVLLWVSVFALDLGLTFVADRQRRQTALAENVLLSGSYELNPLFQKDVDSGRWFTPRTVFALLFGSTLIVLTHWGSSPGSGGRGSYFLVLGGLFLSNLGAALGHVQNIAAFKSIARGAALEGRIRYARPYLKRVAAAQMLSNAVVYGALAVLLDSPFLFGGALFAGLSGLRYWVKRDKRPDLVFGGKLAPPLAPAQWYVDPTGSHHHRYWDGHQWTSAAADAGVTLEDPLLGAPRIEQAHPARLGADR